MKRLRRRLAWLLVRLAERIDPDWMMRLRPSGWVLDGCNCDPSLRMTFRPHLPPCKLTGPRWWFDRMTGEWERIGPRSLPAMQTGT